MAYYTLITQTGQGKLAAAALPGGNPVVLDTIAVGDGGGAVYDPDDTAVALLGQWYSTSINQIFVDPSDATRVIVEGLIPPDQGGQYIREAGIFDDAGDLFAIVKYPETYKPNLADGASADFLIKTILAVGNVDNVTLLVDPSLVLATREYANQATQAGNGAYAVDTGLANVCVIALDPTLTAFAVGASIRFKALHGNTGPSTLKIDALAAKAIKKHHDQDLVTGDIESGGIYTVVYDGVYFQLQSPSSHPSAATDTANTFTAQQTLKNAADADSLFKAMQSSAATGATFVGQGIYNKDGTLLGIMGAQVDDDGTLIAIGFFDSAGNIKVRYDANSKQLILASTGMTYNGALVWTSANGGLGSDMDAGKLEGKRALEFLWDTDIGSVVQPFSTLLSAIAALSPSTNNVLVGTGITYTRKSLATLWNDIGASHSFSPLNGYQKFPSGLMIQWGYANVATNLSGDTTKSFVYPVTFPNNTLIAIPTVRGVGGLDTDVRRVYGAGQVSANASGCTLEWGQAASLAQNCYLGYIAIGY